MGYTHYIRPTRILEQPEWREFIDATQRIIDASGIPIAGWDGNGNPEITMERVSFNGQSPDDYETCHIDREAKGFSFCKTAHRPYDSVVGAVYLTFARIHGGDILSSDGDIDGDEWADARRLAE